MNGKTDIDPILNPYSAEVDRKTYGSRFLNVCFFGGRFIKFTIWRLTVDIYNGSNQKIFTVIAGGANGTERYWNLFWPLGKVVWVMR